MKYLFSLIFVLFILLSGDYHTQYQICCFQGIILAVESKGGRGGGGGGGRGGTSGGSRGGYKGGHVVGGGYGYRDIYILCIIIGTLLGFLVFYGLYLWCCTGEEEEEEKEAVAPEEHIVEQGGVVKVLSLPRV